jgi:RNAse (barnase) inhibitor barstar
MILKLRIDIQYLRRFVSDTYPAAELDALKDIVVVDVVVPLDAVQRSRPDHQRSSRK